MVEACDKSNSDDGGDEDKTRLTSLDDLLSRDELSSKLLGAQDNRDQETIGIDDAIEFIGMGKFQWRMIIVVGLCLSADATEIMLLSFLSLTLQSEWGLSPNQTATLTATVFLGMFIGTLTLGRLGDHCGRRPIYLTSCAIICLFGVLTAFSPNYAMLLVIRFFVGFGVGGLTVPYDILAEFLPNKCRKFLISVWYFWAFGSIMTPSIAYFTLEKSWRLFVILCSVPCFLSGLLGIFLVPESPRWLISAGKQEKAALILRDAATANGLDPDVLFHSKMVLIDESVGSSRFLDLLSPRWRKISFLLWATWAGFAIGYYGVIILITRIFEQDAANPDSINGDAPEFDYASILISSSSEFVGIFIAVRSVDKFGRVPTQAFAYLLAGTAVAILSFSANRGNKAFLVFISFCARAFEAMGSNATWMYTTEILTTEIRATGHSVANSMARFGAFLTPYIISSSNSFQLVGSIMLGIHLVTSVAAYHLPETKGHSLGQSTETEKQEDADSVDVANVIADEFDSDDIHYGLL